MSAAQDGGPAFPKVPDDIRNGSSGMILRDWFAGQVLGAVLQGFIGGAFSVGKDDPPGTIAHRSYEIADAMLAAREGSR